MLIALCVLVLVVLVVARPRASKGDLQAASPPAANQRDLPEWASFFETAERFRRFVRLVEEELARRGEVASSEDGVVTTSAGRLGLQNVGQACARADESEWPRVVRAHFDAVAAATGAQKELESASIGAVLPRLRVRLQPADSASLTVSRAVGDEVRAVLSYDTEQSILSVPRALADSWGRSDDELFSVAIANLRKEAALDAQEIDLAPGLPVRLLTGESAYASGHALELERYVDPNSPHGALVATPNRHVIFVHVIRDSSVIQAINPMLAATLGQYQRGPGSISPSLLWWRQGRFSTLPARLAGGQVQFSPPPDFVALLEALVAAPK